jgi:hypothetical protein
LLQEGPGVHLGQLGIGLFPDGVGVLFVDQEVDAEDAAQLEVAPVVDRVADGEGQYLAEGVEFFAVAAVTGAIFFRHAGGAHHAPFVMVAGQPQFRDVAELLALGDFALLQVRVVVDDRKVGCDLVVELAGDFRAEEEVLVHECSHLLVLALGCSAPSAGASDISEWYA